MKIARHIFKGRLLNLFLAKKRFPNGYVGTLEIVKHPGAALVIPFLAKDKVILLKQYRPVIQSYIYELPAGTLDKGESPLACARREIIEETGYAAKKITRLGVIFPVPGYSTEKITIYKAVGLTKMKSLPEEDEVIESLVLTKNRVRELFKKGQIVDAKTISALALCGWI